MNTTGGKLCIIPFCQEARKILLFTVTCILNSMYATVRSTWALHYGRHLFIIAHITLRMAFVTSNRLHRGFKLVLSRYTKSSQKPHVRSPPLVLKRLYADYSHAVLTQDADCCSELYVPAKQLQQAEREAQEYLSFMPLTF